MCEVVEGARKNPTTQMWKQLQMGLRAFILFTQKIWGFICYVFKKQFRVVSMVIFIMSLLLWAISAIVIQRLHSAY